MGGMGGIFKGLYFKVASLVPPWAKTYHAVLTPPCQPLGSKADLCRLYKVSTSTAFSLSKILKSKNTVNTKLEKLFWGGGWIKICGVKLMPWQQFRIEPENQIN